MKLLTLYLIKIFHQRSASVFLKKITKKYIKKSYENFEDKAKSQIGDKLYSIYQKLYQEAVEKNLNYQVVFLTDYQSD